MHIERCAMCERGQSRRGTLIFGQRARRAYGGPALPFSQGPEALLRTVRRVCASLYTNRREAISPFSPSSLMWGAQAVSFTRQNECTPFVVPTQGHLVPHRQGLRALGRGALRGGAAHGSIPPLSRHHSRRGLNPWKQGRSASFGRAAPAGAQRPRGGGSHLHAGHGERIQGCRARHERIWRVVGLALSPTLPGVGVEIVRTAMISARFLSRRTRRERRRWPRQPG